jgi:hypothetical protein
LIVKIKTHSPKSHLEVCSIIRFFNSKIIESSINGDEGDYGDFILETSVESLDTFLFLSGINCEWKINKS